MGAKVTITIDATAAQYTAVAVVGGVERFRRTWTRTTYGATADKTQRDPYEAGLDDEVAEAAEKAESCGLGLMRWCEEFDSDEK